LKCEEKFIEWTGLKISESITGRVADIIARAEVLHVTSHKVKNYFIDPITIMTLSRVRVLFIGPLNFCIGSRLSTKIDTK